MVKWDKEELLRVLYGFFEKELHEEIRSSFLYYYHPSLNDQDQAGVFEADYDSYMIVGRKGEIPCDRDWCLKIAREFHYEYLGSPQGFALFLTDSAEWKQMVKLLDEVQEKTSSE